MSWFVVKQPYGKVFCFWTDSRILSEVTTQEIPEESLQQRDRWPRAVPPHVLLSEWKYNHNGATALCPTVAINSCLPHLASLSLGRNRSFRCAFQHSGLAWLQGKEEFVEVGSTFSCNHWLPFSSLANEFFHLLLSSWHHFLIDSENFSRLVGITFSYSWNKLNQI